MTINGVQGSIGNTCMSWGGGGGGRGGGGGLEGIIEVRSLSMGVEQNRHLSIHVQVGCFYILSRGRGGGGSGGRGLRLQLLASVGVYG